MKKVAVLDKSTLSRHLANNSTTLENYSIGGGDGENYLNTQNLSQKNKGTSFDSSLTQSDSQNAPLNAPEINFNSHLKSRSSPKTLCKSTRLGVVPNSFSQSRRYMYSKAADRSVAINDRIERMARKWTSLETSPCSYEELSHPTRASPEAFITVGRIVCDSDAKLNENSVLLESSRSIGSGVRVPLDLSALIAQNRSFSLFPGQIVMLEGVNSDGKCLHVQRFLQPANPLIKIPKLPEAYPDYQQFADGVLAVMVASGPFALDGLDKELNYSPLDALMACVASKQPEVLILCGPFIDSENSSVKAGSLVNLPDQIFHLEISLRISELRQKCPEIRILLVPSLKDLGTSVDYLYPQPPLSNLKFDNGLTSYLSDPCLFFINEICFSVSNNDILLPLAQQSIARSSTDRLSRISSHLLEQASLYPLMPAAQSANLDYSMLEELELPFTPDVLISTSSLGAFARTIDSSVCCLNPGIFCRKSSLGTAALLSFNPPKQIGEVDSITERLRIDFIQF